MTIGVVGAGRWGATLANLFQEAGQGEVVLFCRDIDYENLLSSRRNVAFTDLHVNDEVVLATDSLRMKECKIVFFAVDGSHLRSAYQQWQTAIRGITVITTKTIEADENKLVLPIDMIGKPENTVYFASGAFPEDIIKGSPVFGTVYGQPGLTGRVQKVFPRERMRVYTSVDITGGQIAAACKNTLALASGIAFGLGLREMTVAGIVCRGLEHLSSFATAPPYEAMEETFDQGGTAMIDTIGTCFSSYSRNLRAGKMVADGMPVSAIENAIGTTEGIRTTLVLAKVRGALRAMPIASAVADVLFGGVSPRKAMTQLLGRPIPA